jgi:hypothetical protein
MWLEGQAYNGLNHHTLLASRHDEQDELGEHCKTSVYVTFVSVVPWLWQSCSSLTYVSSASLTVATTTTRRTLSNQPWRSVPSMANCDIKKKFLLFITRLLLQQIHRQQPPWHLLLSFRTSRKRPRHGAQWLSSALMERRHSKDSDTSFPMTGCIATNYEENGVRTTRFWKEKMIPSKSNWVCQL